MYPSYHNVTKLFLTLNINSVEYEKLQYSYFKSDLLVSSSAIWPLTQLKPTIIVFIRRSLERASPLCIGLAASIQLWAEHADKNMEKRHIVSLTNASFSFDLYSKLLSNSSCIVIIGLFITSTVSANVGDASVKQCVLCYNKR